MKKITIGGVPEHFNLPWYLTLKNKEYTAAGINLRWHDYHGGTGQMCGALRRGEIDMAVILTEGIIRDIANGNPSKIVQVFVKSPLIWGIYVAKNRGHKTVSGLRGTTAAISRYGSGSHLMAYVNAENQGWDTKTDLQFEVVKTLDGALQGLPEQRADYFLWEKYTTKPYVDNGPLNIVGECPTPWPCFVIAVRDELLKNESGAVKKILSIVNGTTAKFKAMPQIEKTISQRYGQKLGDVKKWLSLTEWGQQNLGPFEVNKVQKKLLQLQLIEKEIPTTKILA